MTSTAHLLMAPSMPKGLQRIQQPEPERTATSRTWFIGAFPCSTAPGTGAVLTRRRSEVGRGTKLLRGKPWLRPFSTHFICIGITYL